MPQARLPMRKILEILRLKFEHGLSGRAIAVAVCAALSTVQECLRRFAASGLGWPVTLDETALEALLYPREVIVDQTLPDFSAVAARLGSFKGMTRERVWQEYRQAQPEGLSYSAFCASFARFLGLQKLSAKQFHAPGSAMFVDYAGPPLFITDRHTSVRTAVRVFIAAMGYSHAIYAHATPGERTMDWLDGHVKALTYFGGVPDKIVPDNAKGVVAKTCRYEPVLNASYTDFARHYDCAVVPARVRRPQDKAKVENAVQILERALFPELMAATFFDIESLNVALREGIDRVNAKPFQKRDGSRHSRLAEERAALKPLPATPYEFAQWKRAKVQLDYHVEVDQRSYSVPHQHVGKTVDIRISAHTVEVFLRGTRIASHRCLATRGAYSTVPEHRPDRHQPPTVEALYRRADAIGVATAALVRRQVERKRHPDETLRSIQGILRLAKEYGDSALEVAASQALVLRTLSYRALFALLQQPPPEAVRPAVVIQHEHLRGAAHYAAQFSGEAGGASCFSIH